MGSLITGGVNWQSAGQRRQPSVPKKRPPLLGSAGRLEGMGKEEKEGRRRRGQGRRKEREPGDESAFANPLPPFQMPPRLRSWQPASLGPPPYCSCLHWLLGVAVTVPWNLLLTGPIIRSRAGGGEEVKNALSSTQIREDWHPPKEVGRRNWDTARGEERPKLPGLRGEGPSLCLSFHYSLLHSNHSSRGIV